MKLPNAEIFDLSNTFTPKYAEVRGFGGSTQIGFLLNTSLSALNLITAIKNSKLLLIEANIQII